MFPNEAAERLAMGGSYSHSEERYDVGMPNLDDVRAMRAAIVQGQLLGLTGAFKWAEFMDREFPVERWPI
jgi:hypothetical protein